MLKGWDVRSSNKQVILKKNILFLFSCGILDFPKVDFKRPLVEMRGNESLVQRCYFLTFITEDIDQVRHIYIIACSLNTILILPTIVLNILLIISLYRSPKLSTKPCTKLLYSLAISDVLVGMVIEPAYLVKKVAELRHSFEEYCNAGMFTYLAGASLAGVSFYNLILIAVDRYLVVHSGTKYRTMVTNTRVTLMILAIWTITIAIALIQLAIPRSKYFIVVAAVMIIGFAIAIFCYMKIFITLRKSKKTSQTLVDNARQTAINSYRYKRSISTMLYIFVVFMVSYLPLLGSTVSAGILGDSSAIWGAEALSSVIIYANSLFNPIILFWRMKEIRKSASSTVSSTIPSGKLSLQVRKSDGIPKEGDTMPKNHSER